MILLGVVLDKVWVKIISITGAVGVVAFLFSTLMLKLFNTEIVSLLGSEKVFQIIVLLIGVFAAALIIAILKPKVSSETETAQKESSKKIDLKYENSNHNGDNHF